MSASSLGPGARTRVRRLAQKARYDDVVINEILDEARFCHVAAVVNERPVALPTLLARENRRIYLHGSPANEVLKAVVRDREAYLTATVFDGLRLARSGFESSIAYRSAVVVGRASEVVDPAQKAHALDLFVERVLAGRAREVRPASERELRLTMVVVVDIDEASAKVSSGPTDDEPEDQDLSIWAGTVPARLVFSSPRPDSNGAMASGQLAVPESVRRLLDEQ